MHSEVGLQRAGTHSHLQTLMQATFTGQLVRFRLWQEEKQATSFLLKNKQLQLQWFIQTSSILIAPAERQVINYGTSLIFNYMTGREKRINPEITQEWFTRMCDHTVRYHYNTVNFLHNPQEDTPRPIQQGEIQGVFCWFKLWYTSYLSHCNDECNIMSYWTALWWHLTVYFIFIFFFMPQYW